MAESTLGQHKHQDWDVTHEPAAPGKDHYFTCYCCKVCGTKFIHKVNGTLPDPKED